MNRPAPSALPLSSALASLQAAFAHGAPDYQQRMHALDRLAKAIHAHQDALVQAIDRDFGGRAHNETLLLELFPLFDQIRHARRQLRHWMRRHSVRSAWFLLPSQAFYQYQPLGVAGIIGAWNYPALLTLGPLIDALAAGNHAMLKPSELAPGAAQVIAEIVTEAFAPNYVCCINGDAAVARSFAALPFDHLFFTGSTQIGRCVMQAAAPNLTPVTLELGGKSPVIIHDDYSLALAVKRIMSAKLYNAGQTCIAPDYLLLPAGQEAEFEAQARRVVSAMYPRLAGNPDYTHIIHDRQQARLQNLLANAREQGARIVELGDAGGEATHERIMPPALLFNVTNSMSIMQEEIFGPLLPVLSYRTLDEAIAYVQAQPRPLALYYFDNNRRRQAQVLTRTQSGGVVFNDCLYHVAQHNLPFGGVGASGMGHYHGFDGFVTFSKKRPVMRQRRLAATALLHAPWTSFRRWMLRIMLRLVW